MTLALVKALRPHQWLKSLFVAAPLVFARRVFDPTALGRTVLAVGAFCVLSSAIYLVNDLVDVDKDRAHPVKRRRPIASGALPVGVARVAAAVLAACALGAGVPLGRGFLAVAAGYFVLNLAYSFWLKKIPFVDVGVISVNFLLRVLAGAEAIPVEASSWLLACTLLLSALLGFGKRAHELRVAGGGASVQQRDVLGKYRLDVLRPLLRVLTVLTWVAYVAYTQSEHALGFFHTRYLALTVPFVVFGTARFVWFVNTKVDAESPTDSMLHDPPFMVNLALYAAAILVIIYFV